MKILIVDDSITMRKIIRNILTDSGHTDIVEAGSGSDGLDMLSGVDLIFTDWNMPGMSGRDFVKEVRKIPEMDPVPIIMITTEGTRDSVLDALKAGVNDYVVKPFSKSLFLEKLNGVL